MDKIINILLFCFLLSFLSCQTDQIKDKNSALNSILDEGNIPYTKDEIVFDLPCGKDTVLSLRDGLITVKIFANTYPCELGVKKIELRILPVLDALDRVKYQAYTVDDKGKILVTGGIVRLRTEPQLQAQQPMQIEIKAIHGLDTSMRLFDSKNGGDWILTEEKIQFVGLNNIQRGKNLFYTNCTSCHASNLTDHLNGPALANIHLHRDSNWLVRFTLNPYKMILERDSMALRTFNIWQPVIMNAYENILTVEEIKDIYSYIADSSAKIPGLGGQLVKGMGYGIENEKPYKLPGSSYVFYYNSVYAWKNIDAYLPINSPPFHPGTYKLSKNCSDLTKEGFEINAAMIFKNREITLPIYPNNYALSSEQSLKTDIMVSPYLMESLVGDTIRSVFFCINRKTHEIRRFGMVDQIVEKGHRDLNVEMKEGNIKDFEAAFKRKYQPQ